MKQLRQFVDCNSSTAAAADLVTTILGVSLPATIGEPVGIASTGLPRHEVNWFAGPGLLGPVGKSARGARAKYPAMFSGHASVVQFVGVSGGNTIQEGAVFLVGDLVFTYEVVVGHCAIAGPVRMVPGVSYRDGGRDGAE